jgi:CBS domain-containing protein
MKVQEICTRAVKCCSRETSAAEAADLMWEADCGILPVVDEAGRVVGVVTDRDICMALALTRQSAAELPIRSLLPQILHTCRLSDEVRDSLRTMRIHRVRRLPVVDGAGILKGMLSLSDLARAARPEALADPTDLTDEDIALALKTICSRKPAESPVPAPQTTLL